MQPRDGMSPVEWVKRVNRTWIVRNGLAERADEWLVHLERLADGRMEICCEMAQTMSHRRDHSEDPKPWFYAGLFSRATAGEARRFLANHRLTPASVPALWEDKVVKEWITGVRPETRELLERLREELTELGAVS